MNEEREEQIEQNGEPAVEEGAKQNAVPISEAQPEVKNEEGYLAQLKRTQADLENLQKRTEAEKVRIVEAANETLVCSLLETLDNFERALSAMKGRSSEDVEGIRMVYEGFVNTLVENGLDRISAVGCQFDPHKHEAVMQAEADASEDGQILEEFQTGYMFKSKVIRPSKVKVARGKNEKDNRKEE